MWWVRGLAASRLPPAAALAQRGYSDSLSKNLLTLRGREMIEAFLPQQGEKHFDTSQKRTVYCGFDPTADSLHLGNLVALNLLLHARQRGHSVIALVGGSTALVGDPSGRASDRERMDLETLMNNSVGLKKTLRRVFTNHQRLAESRYRGLQMEDYLILDNVEWNSELFASQLATGVGSHLRLADLLAKESVRRRLDSESGMSVKEFLYPLFQANDWLHLYKKYDCTLQVGGNDQQGNIDVGMTLIKRVTGAHVYGVTVPLLTSSDGRKIGKSEPGGALWLSAERTPPFVLYQRLLNTADADVRRLLLLLTLRPTSEVATLMTKHEKDLGRRHAQRCLARSVTQLVHGDAELTNVERITSVFFPKSAPADDDEPLPAARLEELDHDTVSRMGAPFVRMPLRPDVTLLDVVRASGFLHNDRECLERIHAGGVQVNHRVESQPTTLMRYGEHILPSNLTLLRVAKKLILFVLWTE